MNSQCHVVWKTVQILIRWVLKKPADLDLHCFQLSLYVVLYCCFFKNQQSTEFFVYYQVKYSLDKYIMTIYLGTSIKFWLFLHPENIVEDLQTE